MLDDVATHGHLSVGQPMLTHQHVLTDRPLPSCLDFVLLAKAGRARCVETADAAARELAKAARESAGEQGQGRRSSVLDRKRTLPDHHSILRLPNDRTGPPTTLEWPGYR